VLARNDDPFEDQQLMFFDDTKIVLGVCGGVAAYRACDFTRHLQRAGADVHPILSKEAHQFVSPLTLSSLSKHTVTDHLHALDANGVPLHISLAQWGDALIVYPATANAIAQLAHGLTSDLLTTTALCFHDKPIIISPAMNVRMWENRITLGNMARLAELPNVFMVPPVEGLLACGETGAGHLAPDAWTMLELFKAVHPNNTALLGKHVLVSAGGTEERWDVARVISNRSSGKMGIALADEAYALGAIVTLVTANGEQVGERPYTTIHTPTAREMQQVLEQHFPQADYLLMSAAVSDFAPLNTHEGKLKKEAGKETYTLELGLNPDILKTLCAKKRHDQFVLGFAAESETDALAPLYDKLRRKGVDALAVNNVSHAGIGFGSDENSIILLSSDENTRPLSLERSSKPKIARQLLAHITQTF